MKPRPVLSSLVVVAAAAALVAGSGGSGTAKAPTPSGRLIVIKWWPVVIEQRCVLLGQRIKIDNFAFSPATLTVEAATAQLPSPTTTALRTPSRPTTATASTRGRSTAGPRRA